MEKRRERLLLLYESRLLTRKKIRKILKVDTDLTEIEFFSKRDLVTRSHFSNEDAQKMFQWLQTKPFTTEIEPKDRKIQRLTIFDAGYPPLLKRVPDPPLVLYLKGNPKLLTHTPSLSVVGTRRPSAEAKKKMVSIISPLVHQDWLIVSGMARGIDSYAHHLACYYEGKTIAVLGSGLSHVYPPENKELFDRLAKNQLVVSEYPPGTPPHRYQFPERNRIISGLSFATLVVEAEEKSGSLITADQALEQGRDVFAVPGSPLSLQAQGVNKLIQQGAKLINKPEDIAEEWKVQI